MNTAVYGKTMKKLRKRIDVRLYNWWKKYLKWTLKQSYVTQKISGNNLVAIHKIKTVLTLNKPACFDKSSD